MISGYNPDTLWEIVVFLLLLVPVLIIYARTFSFLTSECYNMFLIIINSKKAKKIFINDKKFLINLILFAFLNYLFKFLFSLSTVFSSWPFYAILSSLWLIYKIKDEVGNG